MKAYGVKRIHCEERDCGDLRELGAPSNRIKSKATSKKATRRFWKKNARRAGKATCNQLGI